MNHHFNCLGRHSSTPHVLWCVLLLFHDGSRRSNAVPRRRKLANYLNWAYTGKWWLSVDLEPMNHHWRWGALLSLWAQPFATLRSLRRLTTYSSSHRSWKKVCQGTWKNMSIEIQPFKSDFTNTQPTTIYEDFRACILYTNGTQRMWLIHHPALLHI